MPPEKLPNGPQHGVRDGIRDSGAFRGRRAAPNPEYSRILVDCRDLISHRLLVSLTSMMDRLADGLFNQANRTNVLSESTLLLESRSVLTSNRAFIVDAFDKAMRGRIDRRLLGEPEPAESRLDHDRELELVDDAQVEEEIAVKNFTQSLSNKCHDQLLALNARIGFLLGERHLATEDNPFGPSSVGASFRDAWERVDIRREGKIVILKMMDAGVIGDINSIYADINRHLANLNVLPHLHGSGSGRMGVTDNASTIASVPHAPASRPGAQDGDRDATPEAAPATGSAEGGGGTATSAASDGAATSGDLFAMLRDLVVRTQRNAASAVNFGATRAAPGSASVAATGANAPGVGGAAGAAALPPTSGVGNGSHGASTLSDSQLAAFLPLLMRAAARPSMVSNVAPVASPILGVDTLALDAATAALTGGVAWPPSDGTGGGVYIGGSYVMAGTAGAQAAGAHPTALPAVVVPTTVDPDVMIASLTRLQQAFGAPGAGVATSGVATSGAPTSGVATSVVAGAATASRAPQIVAFDPDLLRRLSPADLGSQIDSTGAVTIELVAMLFDFVSSEDHVPDAIKSLLYRLQIPVLKAALLDKDFFTKRAHPARLLVNRYAEEGIAWREDQGVDDPLYRKIHDGVDRIQSGFVDRLELFSEVLDDFEAFITKEEARAEKRVQASADEISLRERQEQAVIVADAEIERRIASAQPPEFLITFLRTQWRQVLVNAYVEAGEEGAGWRTVLAEMDNLLWSVQPKWKVKDRKDLVTRLPEMLSRLRTRLSDIEWEINARETFMTELVESHARAVTATMDRDAARAASPLQAAPLTGALAEPDLAAAEEAPCDQYHDLVETLSRGMWLEFAEDSGILVFAKLSWVSPLRGKYLFTHRNGTKAFSLTREELAQRFRDDTARPMETEPLLDRAFSDVLSRLSAQAGA